MKRLIIAVLMMTSFIYADKLQVTASILPQKYFIEKIAGDKVLVNIMVKPGFSPATYEPKTHQMRDLSKSKAYFYIGVPFEGAWLEKFEHSNKKMLMVDTSKGIKKIKMAKHSHHHDEGHEEHGKHDDHEDHHDEHKEEKHHDEHEGHDHDAHHDKHDHDKHAKHEDHDEHDHEEHAEHDDHGHHEGGKDPHIWLDPKLVKIQAKNILDGLKKIDSKNSKFYEENYKNFIKEINTLDAKVEKMLKPYADKTFMVFHPSWGYFAKRYDLEQVPVEIEGKEPKPSELIKLIKEAKEENIKVVFVQPQFSQKSAKVIARSLKAKVVKLNPLSQEWDKELLNNVNAIINSYK